MKNILFLSGMALLSVVSCRNEDNEPQNLLLGTWYYTKTVTYSGTTNTVLNTTAADNCNGKNNWTFAADGRLTARLYNATSSGCTEDAQSGTYVYDRSANTITFNLNNNTAILPVRNLSTREMQLQLTPGDDINGDGVADPQIAFLVKR
ncbi:MAG: hypothetical protein EAS48_06990 [Chryseobacterium sp.]|nr:MAG: hypothetical protein EAS48_06990 [Chryseobacterium sp.]